MYKYKYKDIIIGEMVKMYKYKYKYEEKTEEHRRKIKQKTQLYNIYIILYKSYLNSLKNDINARK